MKQYAIILKTIALIVIAPIVIYTSSVSKTLEVLREYRKLDTGGTHVTSYSAKADTTQEGGPLLSTGAVLASITQACSASGVSVTSYAPEMTDFADGLELWQSELVLSGRFKPLLSITDILSDIPQIKTVEAEFLCDERMRKEDRIRLRLELIQLERRTERQNGTAK